MKISEMAEALGGRIIGDGNHEVYKIANLATAQSNEVSFLSDEKMRKYRQVLYYRRYFSV